MPEPQTNAALDATVALLILGGIFVLSYATFVLTVGDSWTITDTLLALIGTPAMIAAPLFLVAGLLTPRRPDGEDAAQAR